MRLRTVCAAIAAFALAFACAVAPAWADECPEGGGHEFAAELIYHATEDEDGLRVFTCTKCGYSYEDPIPKTGHDWGPWIVDVAATCSSEGLEHRICTHSNGVEHREERAVAALSPTGEHDWVESGRIEPTCEADGEIAWTCTYCGEQRVEALPVLGHEWGEWEPDPDDSSYERRMCLRDSSHVERRAVTASAQPDSDVLRDAPEPAAAGDSARSHIVAPNALDAALAVGDVLVVGGFLAASLPLFSQLAWIAGRRRKAAEQKGSADTYGRVRPDADLGASGGES